MSSPPHDPSAPASPSPPPDGPATGSLWPHSTQQVALPSTGFSVSRFDPLADERAQEEARFVAAFDVCHPALALRAVLAVQIVLWVGLLVGADAFSEVARRAGAVTFIGAAGALGWLVVLCASKGVLRRLNSPGRLAAVLGLGAASAWLAWVPLAVFELAGAISGPRIAGVGLAGATLAALLWGWLGLRARFWQPAQAHARLVELQSRIRPHFLFNALNAALALVRIDPERAESVLEDLSALFRTALADVGTSVSLHEEIELAQRYLAIEQVRFGPRLKVKWEIDPRIGGARVPPLVLQPLVENAVRHGVEPAAGGGRVSIDGRIQRGQAVLTVSNTLPDEPSEPGHGMALANVRERLRLLHDLGAQCDTWTEDGFFHARGIVPLA
ncbi:MAG: sensor histidine kinase [Rubrivivax sp.]